MEETCIFCKIAAKEIPSQQIWEDDKFFAFLDHKPLNPGHTLIIPKKHHGYIFDLPENLYIGIFEAAKPLASALKKTTNAARIGIVVEGFQVNHVHLSLIPLYADGDINPARVKNASTEELGAMAEKIKSVINDKL